MQKRHQKSPKIGFYKCYLVSVKKYSVTGGDALQCMTKNVESTVHAIMGYRIPYYTGQDTCSTNVHSQPAQNELKSAAFHTTPQGGSGKIRFRLIASTCNWYQAEVRDRTFQGTVKLYFNHTAPLDPLPVCSLILPPMRSMYSGQLVVNSQYTRLTINTPFSQGAVSDILRIK